MSRIYFDSPSAGHAVIAGQERHWAGWLTNNLALGALGLSDPLGFSVKEEPLVAALRPAFDPEHWRFLPSTLTVGSNRFALPDGTEHDAWHVLLNTAMSVGSEPVRLLTTIHAQCEIHGWFSGPHRAYVAGVAEAGLAAGVMREGMGWEALCAFLRASDKDPVVMSYSVCDRFPRCEEDDERSREERWAAYFPEILPNEITPQRLNEPRRFGSPLNGFDVRRAWEGAKATK
jgi:hypothetical protein